MLRNLFKKEKLKKSIIIYISYKYKKIIIAPRYKNQNGVIIEQNNCKVFDFAIEDEMLGEGIIENLNKFTIK